MRQVPACIGMGRQDLQTADLSKQWLGVALSRLAIGQLVQSAGCTAPAAVVPCTPKATVAVQILIERGADVNKPFLPEQLPAIPFKELVKQCPTALHLACDRGDLELVKVSIL